MSATSSGITQQYKPGELMRAVSAELATRGFHVREPDAKGSRRLAITNLKDVRCEIRVEDDGYIECDYGPQADRSIEAAKIMSLVTSVLDANGQSSQAIAGTHSVPDLPLRGTVGRALTAIGLAVHMAVYEDEDFYDVTAQLVVTNPNRRECGKVWVSDDGVVNWECDYWAESGYDVARIAAEVVTVLVRAIAAAA